MLLAYIVSVGVHVGWRGLTIYYTRIGATMQVCFKRATIHSRQHKTKQKKQPNPRSRQPRTNETLMQASHPTRSRPCVFVLRVIRVVGNTVVIVGLPYATQQVPSDKTPVAYQCAGSAQQSSGEGTSDAAASAHPSVHPDSFVAALTNAHLH